MRPALVAMGAAVALAAVAAPAQAHVHLERTVPAAGARLLHAPARVTLWFSAPVEARRTVVRVTDGKGAAIPATASPGANRRSVRIALPARRRAPGRWIAEFRTLAADGHAVAGTTGFEVGRASTAARAAERERSRPLGEGPPAAAMAAARATEHGALALVLGGLTFLVVCLPGAGFAWRRPLTVGAAAGVVASGTALALHAADPAVAGDVLATRAGTALLCAHALWIATALAIVCAPPAVALGVALPLVVCPAVAGHPGAHALLVPASALHVAAMAVWLGGLGALWRTVRAAPPGDGVVARAASRFSDVALVCATAVLATGVAQSAGLVSAPADLLHTAHGRLLVLKGLLFAAFIAFGLHQRRASLPGLHALRGELGLAAVVLSVAGALAVAEPAAARVTAGTSIAGVRLGTTEKQVHSVVGRPTRVARDGDATILVFESRKLVVTLLRGRVRIVSTRDRRERTREGVGVGTTRRTLLRRIRRARCRVDSGTRFCVVGSTRRGRSTVFLMRSGRVRTITVARA